MSTLVTVQMQMVTSTTLILQLVIVYGTIHAMNIIEKWSSKRNESVQVMWHFDFELLLLLLLLIKNVFRVTFNRNCYKGTVHKLKS